MSLLPYSHGLNPIEQAWRTARKAKTHNRFFSSLAELAAAVEVPELSLNIPLVSAIMQSVSNDTMAIALAKEGCVDKELWPFPSYGKILFSVRQTGGKLCFWQERLAAACPPFAGRDIAFLKLAIKFTLGSRRILWTVSFLALLGFLIGTILVWFIQCGFAMPETGFARAKNASNIIMKNLMDFCLGTIVFVLLGASLPMGENAFFGLVGKPNLKMFSEFYGYDWNSFFFNLVFCATAATIVSGAMAGLKAAGSLARLALSFAPAKRQSPISQSIWREDTGRAI